MAKCIILGQNSNYVAPIILNNINIQPNETDWVADTTYPPFAYKHRITSSDIKANYTPYVFYDVNSSQNIGNNAVIIDTDTYLDIYVESIPDTTIVIEKIKIEKE